MPLPEFVRTSTLLVALCEILTIGNPSSKPSKTTSSIVNDEGSREPQKTPNLQNCPLLERSIKMHQLSSQSGAAALRALVPATSVGSSPESAICSPAPARWRSSETELQIKTVGVRWIPSSV